MNLLFIDDNIRISAEIYTLFSTIFKSIVLAHDAETAKKIYETEVIDMIITDIEMPGTDGLTFVEYIRSRDVDTPIVILSAYSEKEYLLRAANLQIDGYITKPLSFKKLEKIFTRVVLRLEHRIKAITISDEIIYHPLTKSLEVDNQEISLGNKECLLLELLLNKKYRVVSKHEIKDAVWPDEAMSESALKNLLGELRKKLKYNIIKNQPARGWILRF